MGLWTHTGQWDAATLGHEPLAIASNGCGYYRVIASGYYGGEGRQVARDTHPHWGSLYHECQLFIEACLEMYDLEKANKFADCPVAIPETRLIAGVIRRWRTNPIPYGFYSSRNFGHLTLHGPDAWRVA